MNLSNAAPADNTTDVRRDWSLTVDITDLSGIDSDTVVIKINGVTISPTLTTITNGYRAEYTPSVQSGYGARVEVVVNADVSGSTKTDSWRFSVEIAQATATSAPPPAVVVVKDISLTAAESDEIHEGVNVVWLPEKTHPLIVDESQAEAVGTVEVENNCYHKHVRTLRVDRTDDNNDVVSSLQEGDLITFTATALSETVQKAEVLAIKQNITTIGIQYDLTVQYYESV